jgi:uncharacterized protein (TIGR02246 family)
MMKRAALAAAALLFAAGPANAEPEGPQLRQSDFLAAMSARDLERVVEHFAEDAVVQVANMPPIRGRDAIRQLYGNVFRFLSAAEYSPEFIRVSGGADMAYSAGGVTTVFDGQQGPVVYPGKYLLVWEKREGDWLIVVYSVSNNQGDAGR